MTTKQLATKILQIAIQLQGRCDCRFLAKHLGGGLDKSLPDLQRDVAGKPVAHDDVGAPGEQLPGFEISNEVQIGAPQPRVSLANQVVAFLSLLADRKQPHARPFDLQ